MKLIEEIKYTLGYWYAVYQTKFNPKTPNADLDYMIRYLSKRNQK